MTENRIKLSASSVLIENLDVRRKDIAEYVRRFPDEEQEWALIDALEVGVFCLERCRIGQDVEFVRRQLDALLNGVLLAVSNVPSTVEKQLMDKIGTGQGQVLAPMLQAVKLTASAMTDRVQDVKKLLSDEIDPKNTTSVIGKALTDIKILLDARRDDSIQGCMREAIAKATGTDGALVQTVKASVAEAVKPLAEEVDRLAKEVRGREAAEDVIQQTVLKGFRYEDAVLEEVNDWATRLGGEVHYVADDNRPGDILIEFGQASLIGMSLRIVIEVRNRQGCVGRKVIGDTLLRAMAQWEATTGVFLSHDCNGLAKEIGDWAEGECERGTWVAVPGYNLRTALRFLVAMRRLHELRESAEQVDVDVVRGQIKRMRTALARVTNIKRTASSVRSNADDIQTEAEGLRDEIRSALCAIEDALGLDDSPGSSDQSEDAA